MKYKLVAFDLDGTLLDSQKRIPGENTEALCEAYEKGMYIVPATGRIYPGLPAELRAMPFVRYCISVNGALLYDAAEDRNLDSEEISPERALQLIDYFDMVGVPYDCYQDNRGWMNRNQYEMLDEYISDRPILEYCRSQRTPVDDLKTLIKERNRPVQKMQMHFKDMEQRSRLLELLPERFPDLAISSSVYNNIEFNAKKANKGDALVKLCGILGIDLSETVSFGDGSNDISMLRAAGMGVAMGNAPQEVKDAADAVTGTNDEAGFARMLRKLF